MGEGQATGDAIEKLLSELGKVSVSADGGGGENQVLRGLSKLHIFV